MDIIMYIIYSYYDDYESHSTNNIFVTNDAIYAQSFVDESHAIQKTIIHKINNLIQLEKEKIKKQFRANNPFIDMRNMSFQEKKLSIKTLNERDEKLDEILNEFDSGKALSFFTNEEKDFLKSHVPSFKEIENISFGMEKVQFIQA